jgi:hypothetical protein
MAFNYFDSPDLVEAYPDGFLDPCGDRCVPAPCLRPGGLSLSVVLV